MTDITVAEVIIEVLEPGCHYAIKTPHSKTFLRFQENGNTTEAILAILIDRVAHTGTSGDGQDVLEHLNAAMGALDRKP
jgi:hypothetical protein